jgi:uncharacterized protein YndB with AHSA1/START domain
MSVKQQADGRRALELEFEIPGTPEEAWDAIATGPGLSAWFVPTRFEPADGRPTQMVMSFGPGAESRAEVTGWDPPRSWSGQGEVYGGSPPIATEWHIEAKAGGTCRVRMVHSLFASTDEWDNQLEGAKEGWAGFINNLRLYMTHFRGRHGAIMQVSTPVAMSEAEAWDALTNALGVGGAGQRWTAPEGAPALGGVVEVATKEPFDALLRLDTPMPGLAALGAFTYPGSPTMVGMNLYLYGDEAAATVEGITPKWNAWFQDRFTMAAEATQGSGDAGPPTSA